jgi:Resolvase, N terminal domain
MVRPCHLISTSMSPEHVSSGARAGKVFGQGQKNAKMVRAGLYARVSTQDQQTLPMQNRTMREYAARRGWAIQEVDLEPEPDEDLEEEAWLENPVMGAEELLRFSRVRELLQA